MNQYAPTKKINVPDDVLAVLKRMEWSQHDTRTHGVLVGQLERPLYLKTNKVLVALGGKWNRKGKAHIFDHDPRPALGIIVETGALEIVKDGFFPTPLAVGLIMAEMADILPGMDVLEPSAGRGDLIAAIFKIQPRCRVFAIEIDDGRQKFLRQQGHNVADSDFFHHTKQYDRIVQNPPFEKQQDVDHVLHAWKCLKSGGILVSVMSESAFFRDNSKSVEFRMWLNEREHEMLDLEAGAFHKSGTDVKTRIVKIAKEDQ